MATNDLPDGPVQHSSHLLRMLTDEEKTKLTKDNQLISDFKRNKLEVEAQKNWDLFYKRNTTKFFKDRQWTTREFTELAEKNEETKKLLEVGCGVGNFIFPLLEQNTNTFFYACDFSPRAVQFVKDNPLYDTQKCLAFQCDLTKDDLTSNIPAESLDLVTIIFVLSAINPDKMKQVLRNISCVLKPGGKVLFRDYGIYDYAMLRFQPGHKISSHFYVRQDGTRAFYFTLEQVEKMFVECGFLTSKNEYIRRQTVNKKEDVDVPRVFVQGTFIKPKMPANKMTDSMTSWPRDVGILASEIYFPSCYVDQEELEEFDKVSQGKYTIGLGQLEMGFCTDREDINSLVLTVVQKLIEKEKLSYQDVGYLAVGTETIVDKSKSTKTVLMQLFEESGNTDIEGVDVKNACYGGTAALFGAVNWVESSSWDGRYALVVMGDIAVYASGNARCTGGAGAVAMLVGPGAPLVMDIGLRATYMQHTYDFYKPDMISEYPIVDGKLSIECYFTALDKCYKLYKHKLHKQQDADEIFTVRSADYFIFHTPFCKLVEKSLARLVLNDFLDPQPNPIQNNPHLQQFSGVKLENTYFDRDVEKAFMSASKNVFEEKTLPSLTVAKRVGNMYTPSLYGSLISIIASHTADQLAGRRIILFSYGSGLTASMFSLTVTNNVTSGLTRLVSSLNDVTSRLDSRQRVSAAEFDKMMKLREQTHHLAPYIPGGSVDTLFPGTWYLTEVDDRHRKQYVRKHLAPSEGGDTNCDLEVSFLKAINQTEK